MITRITFDKAEAAKVGIRTEVMRDLGPMVVLAGPNGHGKSRHLELVQQRIQRAKLLSGRLLSARQTNIIAQQINTSVDVAAHESRLRAVLDETTDSQWVSAVLLKYRPELAPTSPDERAGNVIRELRTRIDSGDYASTVEGMHVYLTEVAARLIHGTHPDHLANGEIAKAHHSAIAFNDILDGLLGTRVTPLPATTDRYDPQPRQVTGLLGSRLATHEHTRVLEIGAGRGRMVSAIADAVRGVEGADRLRYRAYNDPRFVSAEEQGQARAAVAKLAATGATASYVANLAELRALPDEHADVVLLCNVLHEIPVTEWLKLFKDIRNCSQPDATLVVVEDQLPRLGELPHPRGFLLLEEHEWKALIGDTVTARREQHGGRDLTSFSMSVSELARATSESLGRAIDMVARRSLDAISALRDQPTHDHRAGRRHAFFAILHVNATLAQQHYPPPIL